MMSERERNDIGRLMRLNDYHLVTFNSTSMALKGEKTLKSSTIPFVVMPAPREISAGCGLSLKYMPEHYDEIRRLLDGAGVEYSGFYHVTKKDGTNEFVRMGP